MLDHRKPRLARANRNPARAGNRQGTGKGKSVPRECKTSYAQWHAMEQAISKSLRGRAPAPAQADRMLSPMGRNACQPVPPSAAVVDAADGLALIRARLASRRWWLVVGASRQSLNLIRALEDRYPLDLALVNTPSGMVALAMVCKADMTAADLADVVGLPIDGDELDVIFTPDTARAVVAWLGRVVG